MVFCEINQRRFIGYCDPDAVAERVKLSKKPERDAKVKKKKNFDGSQPDAPGGFNVSSAWQDLSDHLQIHFEMMILYYLFWIKIILIEIGKHFFKFISFFFCNLDQKR